MRAVSHWSTLVLLNCVIIVAGCTSTGSLGNCNQVIGCTTLNGSVPCGVKFEELGPVEGSACRHFILAIIPFGDSTCDFESRGRCTRITRRRCANQRHSFKQSVRLRANLQRQPRLAHQ